MKTYMFPGQGSQSKGMGADLFDSFPELVAKADSILGYSIRQLCLDDPGNELGQTQFTQPALYVVNAMAYLKKIEEAGKCPDFVAGHSLGEFNALLAAGVFDFETGLKLVHKRGELMGQVSNGAMAAVVNTSKKQIEEILKTNGLSDICLANYNTPSQIVLSGLTEAMGKAEKLFPQGKMRFYPLATSGAFHSTFMRDAMTQFRQYLDNFTFAEPTIPVIANVTARPYDKDAIVETLASQIASMVRWSDSIQYLMALGLCRGDAMEFEEMGQGETLISMARTIKALTDADVLEQLKEELSGEKAGAAGRSPAEQKVLAWNKMHPVGTKVKSSVVDADTLETRTEAVVLFLHRAAVYLQGYNGYFDLDELTPA